VPTKKISSFSFQFITRAYKEVNRFKKIIAKKSAEFDTLDKLSIFGLLLIEWLAIKEEGI